MALVPDDLVVRVVRRLKTGEGGDILKALEKTRLIEHLGVNVTVVRRLVCLVKIPEAEWWPGDQVWITELARAEKALLGVWSGKVKEEAVLVHLVHFGKSPDYRRLYLDSLEALGWGAEFMTVAKRFLLHEAGGDSAV